MNTKCLPQLHSAQEMISLVEEVGFLPFFADKIPGFSVEECTPASLWFVDGVDGPWEWKGPAASSGRCVYGKFFHGRAGLVSLEWLPDFANYRRNGYDFEGFYEDGLAPHKDKAVYDVLGAHGSLLSKELKKLCDYRKGGNKGFDTIITRLQMQTFVNIAGFEYSVDKHGHPYGWGIARYTTPEAQFGEALLNTAVGEPQASYERMLAHLTQLFSDMDGAKLARLLKG